MKILFIIIIIIYLNLSALQMKESLESGPLETIRIIIASWKLICYELGIFRHRECPYRLD